MLEPRHADVIIVGAGPAGLAAAAACRQHGLNVLVIESGPAVALRHRAEPTDIASGVGGAGLFSDGKFSFYPYGIEAPQFPNVTKVDSDDGEPFSIKDYLSKYMPLNLRYEMIGALSREIGSNLLTGHRLTALTMQDDGATVHVVSPKFASKPSIPLSARTLIVCTGRLGPLLLQRSVPEHLLIYRRLEVGVRIEQRADLFFLRAAPTLDPKCIWRDPTHSREWRTFCCCRDGEIVTTSTDNVLSVSGRADIAPTGRSSVGFHLRVLDQDTAEAAWAEFGQRTAQLLGPITEPIDEFLTAKVEGISRLHDLFGPMLANALQSGLQRLLETFQTARNGACLHGPVVEGVLHYPAVSAELRLGRFPVWIAGDASGLFRGITAALVSGYFVGRRVGRHLGTLQ